MLLKSFLLLLNATAALNGVLIAAALVAQERFGRAPIRLSFAGFIFLISALLGVFVALDSGAMVYTGSLGVITDVMALTAGACFLSYVVAVGAINPHPAIFAPPVLYFVSVLVSGGRYLAQDNIAPIILVQIAYTLAALAIYLSRRGALPSAVRERRENMRLPMLFAGIGLLHAAQSLRLLFPESVFLFDLVPFVGAAGLLVISVYGIVGSQTLAHLGQPAAQPPPNPSERIETALTASKEFLDPDVSLQKVAAATGMRPRDLSQYLNHSRGQSFRDFINEMRIDEAKRLLSDPAELETSIEAIALLSGFKSRSSFYEAFKKRNAQSPAEFRKRAAAKP